MSLALEADLRRGAFRLEAQLEVAPGECLVLAGPSGAGKTTLLRLVAGLERPDRGRVECAGETWLDTRARIALPPERRACGYLFQEGALFPHMRAWQNVAYPLRDLTRRERRSRAVELLERFGVAQLAESRPRECSGGERQRIALARALARRPTALLLDEPLSALDPRTRGRAAREIAGVLRDAGVPTLLVSHDFAEGALLGDRIAVLEEGTVVQAAPPRELAAAPASAFVADLTGAVVLTGSARPGPEGLTLVDLDGGGTVASSDIAAGPVAATVSPWDVSLEPAGSGSAASALNRLEGTITTVAPLGNRARVTLAVPQPLFADVTERALRRLGLEPGGRALASWKATATRLVPR